MQLLEVMLRCHGRHGRQLRKLPAHEFHRFLLHWDQLAPEDFRPHGVHGTCFWHDLCLVRRPGKEGVVHSTSSREKGKAEGIRCTNVVTRG